MPTSNSLRPGQAESLGRGVRRVIAGNAGLMTGPGTNTYLLGEREFAVLDPGPEDAQHLEVLLAATAGAIRWVLVTHTHRDHSPLAAALAKRTGARLIGLPPPDDGRQDEAFQPDHAPSDGERLVLGESSLVAIHTPGHASNCVCYLLDAERLLFTGDHVLEGVSPVILPPDGNMAAYLHSLEKLAAYGFERIAPGHGGLMEHAKQAIEALHAHRLAREDKVLRSLRAALGSPLGISLDALTAVVYEDVPVERHPWARLSLEAHLIKLADEGRVSEHLGSWTPTSV